MTRLPAPRRLPALAAGALRVVLGAHHIDRFLRRASHALLYPVVFNEPVNWMPAEPESLANVDSCTRVESPLFPVAGAALLALRRP